MQLGLEGAGVVVAGGSRGIGASIVRSFLAEGRPCRRGGPIAGRPRPARRDARAPVTGWLPIVADVGDAAECARLIDEARAVLGRGRRPLRERDRERGGGERG